MIEDMKKNSKKLSSQEFNDTVEETFSTILSNQKKIELCPGGEEKQVTKENLSEFIKLLLEARFSEGQAQMNAIREGVDKIIPLSTLKIFTWEEVEIRCTGDKVIDTDKLKSITTGSTGEAIDRFWRVWETFTEKEK